MPYVAPFRLPDGQPFLPDGEFLVPLCTTRERLTKMLTVLTYGGLLYGQPGASDYDHVIDLMRALGWVDDPCLADCFPCEEKCIEYPPYAQFIDWLPQNPFTQPELIPPGYTSPPFYIVPDTLPFVGTQKGDVIVSLNSALLDPFPNIFPPPFGTILELLNSGFPRFRVNLPGLTRATQVELHMVSFPSAGIAYITQNANPIGAQWVDLNIDVTDLVPFTLEGALASVQIVELEITTPGDHFIDVTFLPYPDDDFPFAYFGGGLRKVVICGQDARSMAYFRLRQNPEDPCLMEQQLQPNGAWLAAFDYGLCNSTFGELIRLQNQQKAIINRQYTTVYDGTPGSINPSAPTTSFSDNNDRETALCMAAVRYVSERMSDAWYQARAQLLLLAALYSNPITRTLDKLVGGISILPAGLTAEAVIQAAENGSAIDDAGCGLADALKGDAISEAAFFTGIDSLSGTGDVGTIYTILKASRGRSNYLYFLDLLGAAWDLVQAGVDDCPCNDEWCYDIDFTVTDGGFVSLGYGQWVAGTGWRGTNVGTGAESIYINRVLASFALTRLEITVVQPNGNCYVGLQPGDHTLVDQQNVAGSTFVWTGERTGTTLVLNPSSGVNQGGYTLVTRLKLWGTGENPFGTDNCE